MRPSSFQTNLFLTALVICLALPDFASAARRCRRHKDCNDRNLATVDYCANPRTRRAMCINKPSACPVLAQNGDPASSLDVVFIPNKYTDLADFAQKITPHYQFMLTVEPFKSKKERINFYYLAVADENFGWASADITKRDFFLGKSCPDVDELILVSSNVHPGAPLGRHIAETEIDPAAPWFVTQHEAWTTTHEFGHSFGGLLDTYWGMLAADGVPSDLRYITKLAPNVDGPGCPKWCTSHTGPYSTACTAITNKQQCISHNRVLNYAPGFGRNVWSCNTVSISDSCCVWLDKPDPFFGTRCVNHRHNQNIGIGCVEGTGCYYGANGQALWRSVSGEGMDGSIMDNTGGNSFGALEVASMNKIFECCYGREGDQTPQRECKSLARKYHAFRCNASRVGAGR